MALTKPNIYTEDDYYALPENKHAELIEGELYNMAAPSRLHQEILMELSGTIHDYIKSREGDCRIYPAPFAVRLFEDNKTIVEPDISVICSHSKLTDKGCSGAPDWIIEIVSPSTSSHDYIRKLNLYWKAGVREYWIADPRSGNILVYYFEQEDFQAETYTFKDNIKVNIFEDLAISLSGLDV